ncbi:hypothetical protein DdX_10058 [Ditylenchus destructor]|uniref:Uncharacterized protein n=1 Tax=Ditylenchus destructor TaxID=166010 RepID=A0AAD4R2J4_9BILA|nr:hypothetical protein DdX_10058 [Ditylenchus destructor]
MSIKFSGYATSVLFAFASILFNCSPVQGLSCYQGQIMIGQTVNSSLLMPCTFNAKSCIKQMDFNTRVEQHGCSTTNCTDLQGQYSSESICKNMTLAHMPYLQHCCCYGDGCNGGPEEANYTMAQSTNVQNGVSSRNNSSVMSKPSRLKCYQGQTRTGQTVNSSLLMPCTFNAYSCLTQTDFQTGVEQRGCQSNNCTHQTGQLSFEPICTNMTRPPYLQQCCCYGDGCNGGPDEANYTMVQSTNVQSGLYPRSDSSFMSKPSGLKCYQGRTMTGQTVNSSLLTPCTFNAYSCLTQTDFQTGVEYRGCQTNNCTNQQGQYSSGPICTNMTRPPYLQQCCCYGDGCNGGPEESNYTIVQSANRQNGVYPRSDSSFMSRSSALKCYQGQTMRGQTLNSSHIYPCTFNAFTCVTQTDFQTGVEQRGCQSNNCTNQRGQYASGPICTNMTQPPYLQQCCCYGDACNGGPGAASPQAGSSVWINSIQLLLKSFFN